MCRLNFTILCVFLIASCSSGQATSSTITENPKQIISPTPIDVRETPPPLVADVPSTIIISTPKSSSQVPESSNVASSQQSQVLEDNINPDCPPMTSDMDHLTQEEFIGKLTDSCRYDRLIKPKTEDPLKVTMQIDLLHIESSTESLQFKSLILVQLGYEDQRLKYQQYSPNRTTIMGEQPLRNKIWVPHLIVQNERESTLMGPDGKDVFVRISPNGQVVYSYRIKVTFYCWMNLKKFPFDDQTCAITWASWSYDVENLELDWEGTNPFQVARNLHLTEFVLVSTWTEKSIVTNPFSGGIGGNYSACTFNFKLRREVGYYMMDYFIPSIMLVSASWVTFWLQADAGPPRATLGASTMLSFITLSGGLSKSLPKVSYIKASEIWFLGCSSFIFLSLAEFAFVNVIWRRKKKVELKKYTGKHILKGALTPSLARKQLRKSESLSSGIYKTRSCSSLDSDSSNEKVNMHNNYLTVHSLPLIQVSSLKSNSKDELIDIEGGFTTIPIPERGGSESPPMVPTWTTMTPQEVAIWIDKKSRIVFPVSFLIFNLFYWSFVYAL